MPATCPLGDQIIGTPEELDANGSVVPYNPANITWNPPGTPSVASMVQNSDGTATFTALAPGTTTVSWTDGSDQIGNTDTLTVSDVPVSGTTLWGTPTPVSQPATKKS